MSDKTHELLDEIHRELLLHPDAGTTRMDTGGFWAVFYRLEAKVAEVLEEEDGKPSHEDR